MVFGGSFNPIHLGHLQAAQWVSEHLGGVRVRLMLASNPRLRNEAPIETRHRWNMLNLACKDEALLKPDDLELKREGVTHTIDTVRMLKDGRQDPIVLVLGDEAAAKLDQWVAVDELKKNTSFLVLKRAGVNVETIYFGLKRLSSATGLIESPGSFFYANANTPDISATAIRRMRRKECGNWQNLVSPSVASYIIENELYKH